MKKVFVRIFAFALALYISFLSVFNSFHVNVYASGVVPNPNGIPPELLEQLIQQGIVEQTYKYISEQAQEQIGSGGGSHSSFPNVSKQPGGVPKGAIWNPYIQSSLELAMMQITANNGFWDGVALREDQAFQMTKDFCSEHADEVFKALVIDPSNAAKDIFWNYPNQAVGALLEASNASIIAIADNYVVFSDAFLNKLKSFAQSRIKDGVYYPLTDDPDISRVNGNINIPETYTYKGIQINTGYEYSGTAFSRWDDSGTIIMIPVMCRMNYGSYYLYNVFRLDLKWNVDHFDYYQLNYSNTCNLVDITQCDLYTFDYDVLQSLVEAGGKSDGWFKNAINFRIKPENVVLPVNHPVAVTAAQPYPIPGLAQAIQASHDLAGQNMPQNGNKPIPVPYPVPEPIPVTYPVPDPAPIGDILPVVEPDPDPDPDPDPVPDPDPEPQPDPIPEDPIPEDPDPEDPEIEIPDDWGGNPLMDLSGFFPFCLPMDLYLAFTMLTDEAEPPVFEIPVNISLSGVNQSNYQDVIVIDIIQPAGQGSGSAEPYVKYLRFFLTFLFIVFLIFTSIKITPH